MTNEQRRPVSPDERTAVGDRYEGVRVADGGGVAVVPLEHADAVAAVANDVRRRDQEARERYDERLGMEKDRTLESPGDG